MIEEKDDIEDNANDDGHQFPENVSELTGYDHLHVMCKQIRNPSSSGSGFLNPITPRLSYIMDALSCQGQRFQFVPLRSGHYNRSGKTSEKSCHISQDENKLANVMVSFEGTNPNLPTVIFTAHHDIANPRSENCQDNTASVCNLIHLCSKLKTLEADNQLMQNVIIGFTDCEEAGGRGMNMLVSQIIAGEYGNVESVIALELTAEGSEMWVQGLDEKTNVAKRIDRSIDGVVSRVSTPYNESANARGSGLTSVCIGTLTPDEMESVNGRGFGCQTWRLCHSMTDTFDLSANKEEMSAFVDAMVKMVDVGEKKEENHINETQTSLLDEIDKIEREERMKSIRENPYANPFNLLY